MSFTFYPQYLFFIIHHPCRWLLEGLAGYHLSLVRAVKGGKPWFLHGSLTAKDYILSLILAAIFSFIEGQICWFEEVI